MTPSETTPPDSTPPEWAPGDGRLSVRPLVLGADGFVGRRLTDHLEERYPHTVSATRTEIDITDRWRLEAEIERLRPTLIVNAAAVGNVDRCEREPDLARRVNAEAPAHLANACRNSGVRLLHISTDYVFGAHPPVGDEFDEAESPAPINEYGRSKAAGEEGVLETLADAVVLRVSFVFGDGRPTFADAVAEKARGGDAAVPAVDGWVNKPTAVDDLVEGIATVATSSETGVWHYAGGGRGVSRLEFARVILELLGEDPARATAIDAASLELAAPRPAATPLSTRRWAARFGGEPRAWIDGLREYLASTFGGEGDGRR